PSRTAARAAFRRAQHQMLDRPLVFVDPLAKAVLSKEAQSILESDPARGAHGILASRLRAFLVVRSRIAEDCLASAVAAGVRQYLIFGAGLDTFACRNPFSELRVFEVDHPRTQEWKRGRLKAAGLDATDRTTFVPVDFNTQTLPSVLAECGFNDAEPTAISWLGVLPYLEEHAVWTTLEWSAAVTGREGHIVFDYGTKPKWWQLGQLLAHRRLANRVAAAGEPFRTYLDADNLRNGLTSIGFSSIADLDAHELNQRYFAGRSDGLRLGGSGHVVIASRRLLT
ncbi:MAG TPA: class I SAM-dependent methyltransferase, partial [Gemmatimonadaceae bacterium]|nr:class I SAM-dependent methyltransferase [Gemmatimonadaceae bacterium]